MNLRTWQLLLRAVRHYGKDSQVQMWYEESAELTKELCKNARGADNVNAIAEEIADCRIMLEQLQLIFGCEDLVKGFVHEKLKRLERRIEDEEGQRIVD